MVQEFMHEKLFVCVPPTHELAQHDTLTFADINGFNFLLRTELGFWDTLCRQKMPASRFLVQTDEFTFEELVVSSSLPCFTTDYFKDARTRYPGRVFVPLADPEADVTFYLAERKPGRGRLGSVPCQLMPGRPEKVADRGEDAADGDLS